MRTQQERRVSYSESVQTGEKIVAPVPPTSQRPASMGATETILEAVSKSDRDQFGRRLRYAYSNGVFINQELVRRGLAIAREFPPDVMHASDFDTAQRAASSKHLGIWNPSACGASLGANLVILKNQFKSSGRRHQGL